MKVTFPAMRGEMGGRTYYACMMPLRVVPKMFTFRDWAEFKPEDREQRVLNEKRVPHIAKYIIDNEDGYLFASITASYKCPVRFKAVGDGGLGHVEMDFDEAEFVINDGQHRCAAIARALKENPQLGDEVISVLLFEYESRERMQQMFSDLNRFVQKTSKSLDILYDKRDPVSRLTLQVIESVPQFEGMVDRDAISIGIRSPRLFTLATLYDANKELLRHHDTDGDGDSEDSFASLLKLTVEFWTEVSRHMPAWSAVKNQHMLARDLRQESLASHTTVIRAIGSAGAELLQQHPNDWREKLAALEEIDWRKSAPHWDGVVVVAGSVSSNRQSRQAAKAYIKRALGLELTEGENRSLMTKEQIAAEVA